MGTIIRCGEAFSYRLDEGIILLAGMDITKDLRFGLAYDLCA